ncbi:Rv0518 family GDSL lipase [Mycobacterium sp.]|uniref:Rv0518 family GDSL lipase n=1 Tax=Mycobacterium sp. TaxID=1785 RepID=UPI003D6B0C39
MGRLATFVISLVVVFGMIGQHPAAARPYAILSAGSPVNHVAVIGDSYTTGTDEGGEGTNTWTARAWTTLNHQGVQVVPDVAAEGRAGYGVTGDHGSMFKDLTARAVHPNDVLVVFFGSRNDQGVDPEQLAQAAHDAFDLAHRVAPSARLLVIGPPWPTADPPDALLQARDVVASQARAVGATFVDPMAEQWFVGTTDLIGADGIHPNDAGHAYMADKIVPLIRGQLPRRT